MNTYIILVSDQEQGPYSFSDLEVCEQAEEINGMTPVRLDGHDVWKEWGTIKAEELNLRSRAAEYQKVLHPKPTEKPRLLTPMETRRRDAFSAIPAAPEHPSVTARKALRGNTAYPGLRFGITATIVASVIFCLISLCFIGQDGSTPLAIAGIVTSIASVFSMIILGVLVDIADASLRKVE
jgi:hypothetical protein